MRQALSCHTGLPEPLLGPNAHLQRPVFDIIFLRAMKNFFLDTTLKIRHVEKRSLINYSRR